MLSSAVIFLALLGSAIGFAVDRYAAVIVVLFIARSAIRIFLDSIRVLLDASLDYNSLTRIREIVLADSRVAKINTLWARNAGRYIFVELDLTLRVTELEEGHRLSEEIENRVKMEIAQVDRVLIHFQPQPREIVIVGIPLADDGVTISVHFGEAPLFRLLRLQRTEGKIIEDTVLKNPYLHEEKAKGIKVAQWLLAKGMDILISNHDQAGKGPGFVLGNAGVEMLLTRETNAAKALNALLNVQGNASQQGVAASRKRIDGSIDCNVLCKGWFSIALYVEYIKICRFKMRNFVTEGQKNKVLFCRKCRSFSQRGFRADIFHHFDRILCFVGGF